MINNRYRIVRAVGSGGMGSVFAARDERLGRDVALKILRPDLAADPQARERFLREAQIAAQLAHPNVVRTYDVGDAPEGPFLVQELLRGQTLDALMPLPPDRAIAIAADVADALGYIHQQGYVHCDIKPQNIMLAGDSHAPRVVLLDFGIARAAGTDTTTLIATPHYLAPERAGGGPPTASSDLYALGIVLYQMLSGRLPFDAPSIHAILEQHRNAPLPPLPVSDSQAVRVWPIIEKLTAKQPADRYPSAAALRHDLDRVAHSDPHAHTTVPVTPPVQRVPVSGPQRHVTPPPLTQRPAPSSRSKLWLLAIPLLGLLLLGAIITRGGATGAADNTAVDPTPESTPAVQFVAVPPVVGLPVDEARQMIENAGLTFHEGERVPHDQPADTIIGTTPAADEALPRGGEVVAQISAGPPPAEVAPPAGDDDDDDDAQSEPPEKNNKGRGKGKGRGKDD